MNSLNVRFTISFNLEFIVTLAPSKGTAVMSVSMSDDIGSERVLVFTLVASIRMAVIMSVNMSDYN